MAIGERWWQIEKSRWRYSLSKQTVTIHQHLDGKVSIRFGPHVVGRYGRDGKPLREAKAGRRGKDGSMEAGENQQQVFTGSHTPLEISQKTRDSHFSTALTTAASVSGKAKAKIRNRKVAA